MLSVIQNVYPDFIWGFCEREERNPEGHSRCFCITFLLLHALQYDVTRIMTLCYPSLFCMTQPDSPMIERNTTNSVPKCQTGGYKSIIIKLSPLNKVINILL